MKLVNLGCGKRYHPEWINVDFYSDVPEVMAHDLSGGIPFQDESFDVVYHSHLIEHFSKTGALRFMKDCYRVLKTHGIIRVVAPDLERIVQNYQKYLTLALEGDLTAEANYDWILLEMYDQTVRNFSGGEMAKYLQQEDLVNEDFICQRIGAEGKNIRKYFLENKTPDSPISANYLNDAINRKNKNESETFSQIGKFRLSGEIHQWMYDRFSLTRLLQTSGFNSTIIRKADESYIPGWKNFLLDTETDGSAYKPDSIFIEGIK